MVKEKNVAAVERLAGFLAQSSLVIATDFRGLPVAGMTQLRRELRARGVRYHVVKNTLARLAAREVGKGGLEGLLRGPTALAFIGGDFAAPARALVEYVRGGKAAVTIRGGLLDSRVLSAEEVAVLAALPPREVLLSQVLGAFQAPLARLARVLWAPLQGLAVVLDARRKQMEEGSKT